MPAPQHPPKPERNDGTPSSSPDVVQRRAQVVQALELVLTEVPVMRLVMLLVVFLVLSM